MKGYKLSTLLVTLYLIIYTILSRIEAAAPYIFFMFLLSPVLVFWMVYTILKFATYNGRELKENEEWGYQVK